MDEHTTAQSSLTHALDWARADSCGDACTVVGPRTYSVPSSSCGVACQMPSAAQSFNLKGELIQAYRKRTSASSGVVWRRETWLAR